MKKLLVLMLGLVLLSSFVSAETLINHTWDGGSEGLSVVYDAEPSAQVSYSGGIVRVGDTVNDAGGDHTRLYNSSFLVENNYVVTVDMKSTINSGGNSEIKFGNGLSNTDYVINNGIEIGHVYDNSIRVRYYDSGAICGGTDTLGSLAINNWYNYEIHFFNDSGYWKMNITIRNSTNDVVLTSNNVFDACVPDSEVLNYGIGSVNEGGGYGYFDNFTIDNGIVINPNFTITFKSFWDNSSVSNVIANITGVGLFSNATGSVITTNISSNSSLLYNITAIDWLRFPETYLNYNVSNDLTVYLKQSQIDFACFEKITNNSLNCSNSTIYPDANTYNFSIGVDGYYDVIQEETINVLNNKSIDFTGFYSSVLNITAVSVLTGSPISNFTISLIGLNESYSEIQNTEVSSILFGLINGSYNLSINASGYALDNDIVIIENVSQNLTFSLYPSNSISFNIYNRSGFTLLNTTTVSIALHGLTADYSGSTSNGSYYLGGLNDDVYKITFTSAATSPNILYGTISGGNHLDMDVYLDSDLTEISFLVKNTLGVYQGDVVLSFIQTINGSDITVSQAVTDFSGRAKVYLDPAVDYSLVATKEGYDTFTGTVIPTESEYTITITQEGSERFISLFEDINLQYYMDYVVGGSVAVPYLIITSESGSLTYYGMNVTYNSVNHFVNRTGIPAGGVEYFNISVVPSIRNLDVNYFFKADGHSAVSWNVNYYLINLTPSNNTIEDGMFDDLSGLDEFDPVKALGAMFIIIILFLVFHEASLGNLSASIVGAMLGLGLSYKFSLLPDNLTIVSIIVCGILIVADNIGGGK